MKAFLAAILVAAVLPAAPALASPPADSPLVGHWVLDVDSLPMPPEQRPKSVSLDFGVVAGSKWETRVEIIDRNDHRMHSESTLSLDGAPGPASGTYWVDVLAAKMPAPNVLVMQFVYQGVPASTRVYSVSGDGRVLTETEAYFRDGVPMLRTAIFNRAMPAR